MNDAPNQPSVSQRLKIRALRRAAMTLRMGNAGFRLAEIRKLADEAISEGREAASTPNRKETGGRTRGA